MTLSFMRVVDDTFGVVFCKLLWWIVKIKHLFLTSHSNISPEKVKIILCQKYFGMGSILHAGPLLKGLKKQYPNAKIIFMTLKAHEDILKLCRMADEILVVRIDSFFSFIIDVLTNLLYLMRREVDISIDLEFFSKFTMIVSLASLARVRVGLHQKKIRPEGIMTHNVYYNHYKHITDIYNAFNSALGLEYKQECFSTFLPSLKKTNEKKIREKFKLHDKFPILIINVNAGELFKNRCWPGNSFVELIDLLIKKYPNFYYLLIGGESDCVYVDQIYGKVVQKNGRLVNCVGRTNIEELFALIEMSFLMISNDSGPMHIGSLYGKNVVAFFGPETPIVYGPINKNSLVFYSKDLYCSPCLSVYDSKKSLYDEKCHENKCLTSIKPKAVFEAIESEFLQSNDV